MKGLQKFYICEHCGNIVGLIHNSGIPLVCCGVAMTELVPNTVDASKEKHVPVVTVDGNTVRVDIGSAPHPMVEEHYICWVYIQTTKGGQRKNLQPGEEPAAVFCLTDGEELVEVFAYCNLHGLWKANYAE